MKSTKSTFEDLTQGILPTYYANIFYKLRSNSQRAKKRNHGETTQKVEARYKPGGQRNLTSSKQI
jgi:hypothetical protein